MSPAGAVGAREIERAIRQLGLTGRPIEVHVSLCSFGGLEDGPTTIVEGVLAASSTVLAATMAPDLFGIPAPPDDRPVRNGTDASGEFAAVGPLAERLIGGETKRTHSGRCEPSLRRTTPLS
jgi:hypothetical protein